MSPAIRLTVAALLLPLPAMAQSSYPGPRYSAPIELRVYPADMRECLGRNDVLLDRRSALEQERDFVDREASDLARQNAALADEWRRLDRSNAAAVADYNARSNAHNQRVAAQNTRVAQFNHRAATLNDDTDYLVQRCTVGR